MSEQQKIFASLSGAVVAHLLLLAIVFLLLGARDIEATVARPVPEAPGEVVVVMGELMERLLAEAEMSEPLEETEPEAPEPDKEPDLPAPRPFISTDLNAPEAEAPENARFESDRNTRAASEMAPDASQPQEDLPTTRGDFPFPYYALQDRQFTEGELDQPPAKAAQADPADPASSGAGSHAARAPVPPSRFGTEAPEGPATIDSPPSSTSGVVSGEMEEVREGVDTPPEETTDEKRRHPEERITEGEEAELARQRSFVLPDATGGTDPEPMADVEDRFAAARPETPDEPGETRDNVNESQVPDSGRGVDRESMAENSASETADIEPGDDPEGALSADEGLFAPGFSPEQLRNSTNGTLTNHGDNAVDAEGTPVGRYKKAVKDAIARKWHEYRLQHGEFISWGIVKVECHVDDKGKVRGLRVIENDANAVIADFSLRAILDAPIPPMPPEVSAELGIGGLELKYDIIIY